VKVSVHQQGGILGVDRLVEVSDGAVTVTEHGARRTIGELEGQELRTLSELAAQVIQTDLAAGDTPKTYDSMLTVVNIEDGAASRHLAVRSGQEVPPEVRQLVRAVTSAAKRAGGAPLS
jgi:ABC-type metal ion transport system substrate-binding protein